MKKILSLLLVSLVQDVFSTAPVNQVPATKPNQIIVLDQVLATVYLSDKPDLGSKDEDLDDLKVITQQDIARSAFDGKEHNLPEAVYNTQLELRADSMKMSLSSEDVDRRLEEMGLPREHQVLMAEKWHYSDLDEFKDAVRQMFVTGMSQGFEIESRLVIPQADVQAYYDQNPVWLAAEYEIQTSFVPFDSAKDQSKLKRKLEKFVQTGKGYKVEWSEAILIKADEISQDNQFLTQLKPGQMYLKAAHDGFDLFLMVEGRPARLQPLVERKSQIINSLRNERYENVLQDIKNELQNKSVICYPKQY